jgi:hypothetical protein
MQSSNYILLLGRASHVDRSIYLLDVGWPRTAEVWFAGLVSCPLDHAALIFKIISELPDELWGVRNFINLFHSGASLSNVCCSRNSNPRHTCPVAYPLRLHDLP